MKTLQRILMFCFLSAFCILQAQDNQRKGWDGVVKGGSFSIGYNNTMLNSAAKDAYLLNSSGISADVFLPFSLFRKGWDGTVKGGNFGFNIGGTFYFENKENASSPLPLPFDIAGQTTSEVTYKSGASGQTGFRIGGGPQVNFNLGERFILSPMIIAEYFSMKRNALSVTQNGSVNGKPVEYTLWTQPERNTNGLAITPKIRAQYFFTKNFGIFADGAYIFGPGMNSQVTSLVPLGKPNQGGQYEQQQVELGTKVTGEVIKTTYNAFSASVGLSYSFGGNHGSGETPTPAKANINKSRSNIKQQIDTKPTDSSDDPEKPGSTKANINKSRSNIKQQIGTKPTDSSDDPEKPESTKANINKSRSNIKQQFSTNSGTKDSDKEDQKKKCKTYTAPKIINDYEDESVQINKGKFNIHFQPSNNISAEYRVKVWDISTANKKLVQEKTYPAGFNGSISAKDFDKKGNGTYQVQLQAVEGQKKPSKNDKVIVQNSSCATFENNGLSNTSTYRISSSCSALYEFVIDSAVCVKDKKVKVFAKIKITDPLGIGLTAPTLSNISFKDNATGLPIIASAFSTSLSPLPLIVGSFVPFSFELEGDTCNKDLRITYDVNWVCVSGPQHIVACIDTIKLPCCYCNYCEDPTNSNIQELDKSTTLLAGDNLGISQLFTISPKNISKVEAELVYMREDEMDAACKVCRANENEVYTFIGSNTLNWNATTALNAAAGNMSGTFPSKILTWSCNSKGNLQFNMTVALPGTSTLSCCERHGEICIRFKFTDIDCKTCERLVCYTY